MSLATPKTCACMCVCVCVEPFTSTFFQLANPLTLILSHTHLSLTHILTTYTRPLSLSYTECGSAESISQDAVCCSDLCLIVCGSSHHSVGDCNGCHSHSTIITTISHNLKLFLKPQNFISLFLIAHTHYNMLYSKLVLCFGQNKLIFILCIANYSVHGRQKWVGHL